MTSQSIPYDAISIMTLSALHLVTEPDCGASAVVHETKGNMFGMTIVTMVLHEVAKLFEINAEDELDKLPDPSSVHEPDQLEMPPPPPRPKLLLRHRRRLARNRAYTKTLMKSLPDDLKF